MADPFIKFFPSDFLGGTSGLSPAERGVYITLLCLIYEADGPIERNDGRLARRCGAPKAPFQRILGSLIAEGKIIERGRMLTNARAEKALIDRQNRSQNASNAASERWSIQGQKGKQKQRPEDASASATQCVGDASPEHRVQIEDTDVSSPPVVPRANGKRGSALPKDFTPILTSRSQAVVDGWPPGAFETQLQRFKDHAADKGRTSKDWQAAFRSWIDKADEWTKKDDRQHKPHAETGDGFTRAIRSRLDAADA